MLRPLLSLGLIVAAALGAVSLQPPPTSYDQIRSLIRERAFFHGADPVEVLSVAICETGGTLDPWHIGDLGERGIGQWRPGRGYAWDYTPLWRNYGIDIVAEYQTRSPLAVRYDVDNFAWAFGREARRDYAFLRSHWSCWQP